MSPTNEFGSSRKSREASNLRCANYRPFEMAKNKDPIEMGKISKPIDMMKNEKPIALAKNSKAFEMVKNNAPMAIARKNKPFEVMKNIKPFEIAKNYKTEMCRNWENGECPFGSKCIFAHGSDELKDKKSHPTNYKTKRCFQFFNLGYCQYGPRCQFLHEPTNKRLPIFISLSNSN